MQVTKGTWSMREQCVPGPLSSSPAQEPGNEARGLHIQPLSPCACHYGSSSHQMFSAGGRGQLGMRPYIKWWAPN